MSGAESFVTLRDIVQMARRRLAPYVWDYVSGGAETETTLRWNRLRWARYAFRPRVLRDVRTRSTATTFLGCPLALPVMLAPIGNLGLVHPDGTRTVVRAAGRRGTVAWISTMSERSLEEVAEAATGPLVFQLYVRGDRSWMRRMVRRVEAAGYLALCLTVDVPVYGRRERDLRNRFRPRQEAQRPNLADIVPDETYQAALTWEEVRWLRDQTSLPLILKGILTPEDARLAVEHGVQVVYVSNHGGRQLDYAPATADALAEIVGAIEGQAEVLVDGGILRGTDVVKALALGARAALIGKLQCWALAAGGQEGVERALELLQEEIGTTLGLLGVTEVGQLGPEYLTAYPGVPWSFLGRI
ncbi:MAG: alpha-hydroxy-acid oxidizing protein [Armatimonadetes bacterium]|nr:alpha-hydroxy-acid oxidizing protein [Armatimonadota bacterium]MDW8153855.1 alpha-hydroxy acid oxidase [Armatimonadota bacterium]